ncbi:MAG: hypothetical protein KDC98_25025 [Planctomycetes bacterium]|nr:hypothetical protein [Planctomycetota bacterium]
MMAQTTLRFLAGSLGLGFAVVVASAGCEVPPQNTVPASTAQSTTVAPPDQPSEHSAAAAAGQQVEALVAPPDGGMVAAAGRPQGNDQGQGKGKEKGQGQGKPAPARQEAEPRDIAEHAFPPTIPDTKWHQDAWLQDGCLRCHETGVEGAVRVRHVDMPPILLTAKCRTCHVFIPGSKPRLREPAASPFDDNAFPPMIPASVSHGAAWWKDDCLLCHEGGLRGAPIVRHEGMPTRLLTAKCRTCHVQVRAVEAQQGLGTGW